MGQHQTSEDEAHQRMKLGQGNPLAVANSGVPTPVPTLTVPVPTLTVKVGPYEAAYQSQGQGPTLIFLHGFLGNLQTWDALVPLLTAQFRCITLDLLGFGQSSQPQLRYTIWHQVEFLHGFIQALGLGEVALVGHSYGGWVAVAYGLATAGVGWTVDKSGWVRPDHRQGSQHHGLPPLALSPWGLALVAPAGIRDDQFVGRYGHLRPLLWRSPLVDGAIAALALPLALMGRRAQHREIRRARRALKAQPVAKSFLRDRLRPEDAIDMVDTLLPYMMVPTLVFGGQQDTTIPFWHCETYHRRLPNSTLVPCPDAGHDLPQSHGAAIAQQLLQTWGSQPSPFMTTEP